MLKWDQGYSSQGLIGEEYFEHLEQYLEQRREQHLTQRGLELHRV